MATSVPFDTAVELLIYAFLVLAMFCVGMSATISDVLAVLRNRSQLYRALAANLLAPVIIALGVIWMFPLEPSVQTMLLILAFAPGGINAVQFSTKVQGHTAAAGAMLLLLSTVSLVTAPLAAKLLLPGDAKIAIPYLELLFRAIVLVAAPTAIGMFLKRKNPSLAGKLYAPAMVVSLVCFIASVVLSTAVRKEGLAEFPSGTGTAFMAFILALMATGWALGGPDSSDRQILAVSTNIRNVGLVYVLVDGCCGDDLISSAVLGLMSLLILPNLILTVTCNVLRKKNLIS